MKLSDVPRAYKLWWTLNYAAEHLELALFYIHKDGDFEAAGDSLRACGLAPPHELYEPTIRGAEEQLVMKLRRTG